MLLEAALVVLGVVAVASGAFLAVRGTRSVSSLFLAGHLVAFGCFPILLVAAPQFFLFGAQFTVLYLFSTAFIFAFAVSYPGLAMTTLQRYAIAWAFIPAFAYLLVFLFAPDLIGARAIEIANTIIALEWLAPTYLFARRWLRGAPGEARTQSLWALGPFLFWAIHDPIFVVWIGFTGAIPAVDFWSRSDTLAGAGTLLLVLGIAIIAAARVLRGTDRDARRLAILIVVGFAAAIPQLVVPLAQANAVHLAIDAVSLLFLWYGVARYRVLDVDVSLRRGVIGGTIAAAFLAVFFIVSEIAQVFLSQRYGPYLGVAASGALVFALAPLARLGERIGASALPRATGTETYLAYRKMELYRVALEGALQDGVASPREARALVRLREELGITADEHALLEREARDRTAA